MLNLCSLGQVVGVDQGITCVLQAGEQLEGLFESELDSGGRLPIGPLRFHDPSLSLGCVSPLPEFKPPMTLGTGMCGSVLRHQIPLSLFGHTAWHVPPRPTMC